MNYFQQIEGPIAAPAEMGVSSVSFELRQSNRPSVKGAHLTEEPWEAFFQKELTDSSKTADQ